MGDIWSKIDQYLTGFDNFERPVYSLHFKANYGTNEVPEGKSHERSCRGKDFDAPFGYDDER